MKTSWIIGALVGIALLGFSVGGAAADHTSGQVDVSGAWNAALADGALTYKISGGDADVQQTMRAAIEDWDAAVANLTLVEVTGHTKADINLRFRRGGGMVQGQALRKIDREDFIRSCDFNAAGMAFGAPNDLATLGEITRHEMGHCLGLGHANFDDLMDPTVGGVSTISACDVEAVRQANHWKLVDAAITPHAPHVTHIGCVNGAPVLPVP
jgi:predicted Zn-dependent protease